MLEERGEWLGRTKMLHHVSTLSEARWTESESAPAFAITTSAVRPKVFMTSSKRLLPSASSLRSALKARILVAVCSEERDAAVFYRTSFSDDDAPGSGLKSYSSGGPWESVKGC